MPNNRCTPICDSSDLLSSWSRRTRREKASGAGSFGARARRQASLPSRCFQSSEVRPTPSTTVAGSSTRCAMPAKLHFGPSVAKLFLFVGSPFGDRFAGIVGGCVENQLLFCCHHDHRKPPKTGSFGRRASVPGHRRRGTSLAGKAGRRFVGIPGSRPNFCERVMDKFPRVTLAAAPIDSHSSGRDTDFLTQTGIGRT